MSVLIMIILILASLVLIVSVLMQEGNKQGLGAIGGAAETFLGKNKAKSAEGKLLNITRITAAVFVVLAILATWLSSRTYTVTYYDENGQEYFPHVANEVAMEQLRAQLGGTTSTATYEDVYQQFVASGASSNPVMTEEEVRAFLRQQTAYAKGAEIPSQPTPAKTGYTGKWVIAEKAEDGTLTATDKVLPEKMGRTNYTVVPQYTINSYTLRIVDNGIIEEPAAEPAEAQGTSEEAVQPEATAAPEAEATAAPEAEATAAPETETAETAEPAKEDNVIFEITANYGETIDYGDKGTLPEVQDYYVFYSTSATAVADGNIYKIKLPETMPAAATAGGTTTYYVSYAHGNFVSYFVEQNVYDEQTVEQKDEEGNAVLDENGNPVTTTERVARVDENGNNVTEEIELFPDLYNNIMASLSSQWESQYASSFDQSTPEGLQEYLNAYMEAMSETGVIGASASQAYNSMIEQYTANDQLDALRTFVTYGEPVNAMNVPSRTGYIGVWEPAVPETMGSERLELHAKYYKDATLTVIDDGVNGEKIPADEPAAETEAQPEATTEPTENTEAQPEATAAPTENTDAQPEATAEPTETENTEAAATEEPAAEEEKHNVIFTYSGAGRTIEYNGLALPEAPEGYTVKWSQDLPEVVPEEDTVISVVYEEITETEGDAEAAAAATSGEAN